MDRATRRLFLIALVAVVAVTALAATLLGGRTVNDPGAPSDAQTVDGVIVGVRATGLDRVESFTLRTNDQRTLVFTLGELENAAAFPPGHLVEHQAAAQPVRVWYRSEDQTLVAVRLEDAPS